MCGLASFIVGSRPESSKSFPIPAPSPPPPAPRLPKGTLGEAEGALEREAGRGGWRRMMVPVGEYLTGSLGLEAEGDRDSGPLAGLLGLLPSLSWSKVKPLRCTLMWSAGALGREGIGRGDEERVIEGTGWGGEELLERDYTTTNATTTTTTTTNTSTTASSASAS